VTPTWQTSDGRAQLYRGDCSEVIPALAHVDVVVTDPPYEIVAKGGGIGAQRQYLADTDGFTDCGFDYAILDRFDNWACFGTLKQVPKLIAQAGDRRWMLITWNKPDPAPLCNGNYLPDTEYIIHAWRRKALFGGCTDKARFIVRRSNRDNGWHPNCKPVDVMEKIIINAADANQVVLDPFMGSATTGVACVRLGRRFIGIEKDPKYFDIAVSRIEKELNRAPLFDPKPVVQTSLFQPQESP
jgi:DNA modification methylase